MLYVVGDIKRKTMTKPMTKTEWMNWLEKAWDEAQKAAWSETPECKTDPRAPHGFDRNASHSADRYVCECEGWEPPPDLELVDWEAVAADQAMTIAMMKMEQKREWVGLTEKEAWECWVPQDHTKSWQNIEAKLREKNHG
jgi:hypothetical protein